jgi:hypothetical protein
MKVYRFCDTCPLRKNLLKRGCDITTCQQAESFESSPYLMKDYERIRCPGCGTTMPWNPQRTDVLVRCPWLGNELNGKVECGEIFLVKKKVRPWFILRWLRRILK